MSKHFGVKCHFCGLRIVLADLDLSLPLVRLAMFNVPFEPINCPHSHCRKSDVYVPSDGHYFALGADVADRRSLD